jgi:hypothetical protein
MVEEEVLSISNLQGDDQYQRFQEYSASNPNRQMDQQKKMMAKEQCQQVKSGVDCCSEAFVFQEDVFREGGFETFL